MSETQPISRIQAPEGTYTRVSGVKSVEKHILPGWQRFGNDYSTRHTLIYPELEGSLCIDLRVLPKREESPDRAYPSSDTRYSFRINPDDTWEVLGSYVYRTSVVPDIIEPLSIEQALKHLSKVQAIQRSRRAIKRNLPRTRFPSS